MTAREPARSDLDLDLVGQRIVVTRPRDRAESWRSLFTNAGADVLSVPAFATSPLSGESVRAWVAAIEEALSSPPTSGSWVAVTSVASVDPALDALAPPGLLAAAIARLRWAAVGPATAAALRARGVEPTVELRSGGGQRLAAALIECESRERPRRGAAGSGLLRVLHPGARRVRPEFALALGAAGGEVVGYPVYENVPLTGLDLTQLHTEHLRSPITLLTFASPSAGERYFEVATREQQCWLCALPAVAVGATTAIALRGLGIARVVAAASPNGDDLLRAAQEALGR
ncbi:MAG: uroporphyrinogen-III synthase [Planctomycetota bacterium]